MTTLISLERAREQAEHKVFAAFFFRFRAGGFAFRSLSALGPINS